MGENGAHGPGGEAHDKAHAPALVTILDGFSTSLETMSQPFSKLFCTRLRMRGLNYVTTM